MKRSRIKEIILMLIIASLLTVGCSAETPKPSKPNTESNKEPSESVPPAVVPAPTPAPDNNPEIPEVEETVKPETGESIKPAPEETQKPELDESQKPGTDEKEEPVIVIPDWLSDKSYRMDNGNIIHFNVEGYPNIVTDTDINIISANGNEVVFEISDGIEKTHQTLTRDAENPDKVTISIAGSDMKIDMYIVI